MGNSQSSEIAGVDQLYADLHNRAVRTNDAAVLGASVQAGNRLLSIMPPDHPRRGMRCMDFATIMHRKYQQTKEIASLEKAVELTREALALRPGRVSRAKACALLAALLLDLGLISEDGKLFAEAAELCREAIKLLPMSDPNQPAQHTILARCLNHHYRTSGEEPLLHDCIQLYRGVLAQIPADRPSGVTQAENRSEKLVTSKETSEISQDVAQGNLDIARKNLTSALEDLAKLLSKQLDPECDNALLDRILDTRREIMRLTPTHAPRRARRMWTLAVHLVRCFKHGGGLELIDEAVRLEREVLSLSPAMTDPDRCAQCAFLGTSLASKFNRTKDHACLEEVAQLQRQARSLCAVDDPRREKICANLSSALRVLQTRQVDDRTVLDELVEVDREVVRLRGPSHPGRAEACGNLSKSLVSLLIQTRDMQTMEEIIRLNREVLDLQPEGHPNHEDACINLAISLHARFYNSQNKDAADEAVSLARTVLALRQVVGHSDRLRACGVLADMLAWRSKTNQDQDLEFIDESITHYREAASLPHANRPSLLLQLVDSLNKRHSLTKDNASLDEAILLLRESLAATPPSLHDGNQLQPQTCSNLSSCLLEAFERTRNPVFGRESSYFLKEVTARSLIGHPLRCIDLVKLTLQPKWLGDTVDVAATVLLLEEAVATTTISVHTWYPVLVNLMYSGFWILSTEDVPDHLVQTVLSLYSSIVGIAGVVSSCPRDLQCLVPHVTGSFIFTLAKRADDLAFARDYIERSRDLFWTCALQRQSDLLEDIPPDVVEEFTALVRVAPMEKVKSQDARLLQLIEDIRSRPGLDRFMRGPDSDALMSTAAGGPVVMLIPTGKTCQALIIRAPGEPLATISLAYSGVFGATPSTLFRGDTSNVTEADDPDARTRMREALATLWREVVKPIIDHLGITKGSPRQPRIHWCLTGSSQFNPTPVHAAGAYQGEDQECISDYVVSSYTPTLAALLRARKNPQTFQADQLRISILGTKESAGPTPALPMLASVETEMQGVAEVATHAGVTCTSSSSSATQAETSVLLSTANIIHVACPGIYIEGPPDDKLQSAFYLADGQLTLSEIVDMNLKHGFLAFLSACGTVKRCKETKHDDEVVDLPAALLFVGFQSVVGTMWAIDDRDGPFVAKLFYEKLLSNERIDADAVPYALDYAVTALRESGASPERWAAFTHMGA